MENNNLFLQDVMGSVKKYIKWFIILAVLAISFSGITFIQEDEVAVVLRFGKLVGSSPAEQVKEPGLHFAFPYVIDKIIKVPVGKVQEVDVRTLYSEQSIGSIISSGYALTGDENIVLIDGVVKYKIVSPVEYALRTDNTPNMVLGVVSGTLTSSISEMNVDSILTDQKKQLAYDVVLESQKVMDQLNAGIQIDSFEFRSVQPPAEVKSYFDEVTSAYVKKETRIQEARQYREKKLPEAYAEANSLVKSAQAYSYQGVSQASEEIAEFNGLIGEYKQNSGVVKERVYRDKVESILEKIGVKLVIPEGKETPHMLIP